MSERKLKNAKASLPLVAEFARTRDLKHSPCLTEIESRVRSLELRILSVESPYFDPLGRPMGF